MKFFKEIQVGKFVLRFMPSDNGWMCGISKEMMDALEKQETARAWWLGSSLKEYTDALQELSDRLKKESEQEEIKHEPN
jgi:hypothetical protein